MATTVSDSNCSLLAGGPAGTSSCVSTPFVMAFRQARHNHGLQGSYASVMAVVAMRRVCFESLWCNELTHAWNLACQSSEDGN